MMKLEEIVEGAVGPFDEWCDGYGNSGATGNSYISVLKLETGYKLSWSRPFRGGPAQQYVLYKTSLAGSPGVLDPECETVMSIGTSTVLSDLPDNYGFLVVARNAAGDGAFGRNHLGHDRPSPAEADVCP